VVIIKYIDTARAVVYGRQVMEYSAVMHHMDKRYCYAVGKGRFIFRIQTKKDDIKKVVLHFQDKYLPLEIKDTREEQIMEKACSGNYHDFFETEISIDVVCLRYFFELEGMDGEKTYYGNHNFFPEIIEDIDYMFDCPQNLREEEYFDVPVWAHNKVVYQIFPSRFASSKETDEKTWYQSPATHDMDLKGDLRGIINHFGHIKELGADIIYLTPVFKAGTQHKYDTIDYYQTDPDFGTKEDLKELVELAHSNGIRVLLDGVFNHTSDNFFAFADIREKGRSSRYWDWYYIEGYPLVAERGKKPNYKCFSYYGKMPKLNLDNPETREYFIQVACYWLKECNIDGWRLDVADEISHNYWKYFRKRIREINPEALIIGEVWHYAGDFLEGDEWDGVMNYPFYNAVKDFVALEKTSASQFTGELGFIRGNSHIQSCKTLFNLVGSHDTPRFMHICNGNKEKLKLAASLQMLLPGSPMIYYGDEYAMEGGKDPDCRRGMVWDRRYQDQDMFQWYKTLIKIRKKYSWITDGRTTKEITLDNERMVILEKTGDDGSGVILFHAGSNVCIREEYKGLSNVLADRVFTGKILPYETVVLIQD